MDAKIEAYKIAFEGMRAYHESEIQHKKDAISTLNNITVLLLSVYGGLFILSFEHKELIVLFSIINWVIPSVYLIFALVHNSLYKNKIKADNQVYKYFREECRVLRNLLGITADFEKYKFKDDNAAIDLTEIEKGEATEYRNRIFWDIKFKDSKWKDDKIESGFSLTNKIISGYHILIFTILIIVAILFQIIICHYFSTC